MKLTIDCRTGVHNQDIEIANVDAEMALSWLTKLDGKQHTLLNLKRSDDSNFMIGGGPLWYIVAIDYGNKNLTLQNPAGLETEMVELCAGGQYGEYSKAFCVDQKQAAQAALLFFKGTELKTTWV